MSKKKDHTKVTFQLFVIFYQPDSRLDCVIYRHQVVTSQEVQWPRWRLQDTGGYRCYRDGPEPVNTVLLCAVFNSLIAARSLHVLTESIFFSPQEVCIVEVMSSKPFIVFAPFPLSCYINHHIIPHHVYLKIWLDNFTVVYFYGVQTFLLACSAHTTRGRKQSEFLTYRGFYKTLIFQL